MSRTILFSLVLLLCPAWMIAQQDSTQSSSSGQTASASASASSPTTIEGCLNGSDGNYTLTDKSGNTYQLAGDTGQLEKHVGHTIQVTGTTAMTSASTNQQGAMSSPSQQNTMNVTSFTHVSTSCNPISK